MESIVTDYIAHPRKKIKESKDKFQVADCSPKYRGPFPKKVEDPKYVEDNRANFISKCSEYAEKELSNLSSCLEFLHADLKDTVLRITEGIDLFKRYAEYKEMIFSLYNQYGGIDKYIELKKHEIKRLNKEIDEIKAVEDGWLQHFSTEHWLLTLFAFLPPVKNRIMIRNRRYYNSTNFKIEADFSSQVEILNFIDDKRHQLRNQKRDQESDLKKAESEKNELEGLGNSFLTWIDKNKIEWQKKEDKSDIGKKTETNDLYNLLEYIDTNLRYKAFKIATHYWECRWLIQMEEQISGNYKETVNKENLQKKWQRYAKLTPCIVSTLRHQIICSDSDREIDTFFL